MPKKGRKKKLSSRKASVRNERFSDVNSGEFDDSNNPGAIGRALKSKRLSSAVIRQILENTDPVLPSDEESEEQQKKVSRKRKKGKQTNAVAEDHNQYTKYPLQIWLLLADYMRPEDIKTFSLICKDTWSVVNTPFFWIRLYKRYYKRAVVVPKLLSPEYILDIHCGLKQNVVRALFYYYPPFVSAIQNKYLPLETINGQWIMAIASTRAGSKSSQKCFWQYHIKLCNKSRSELFKLIEKKPADIHYNKENECSILEFILDEYMVFPRMGTLRLMSATYRQNHLLLKISNAPSSYSTGNCGSITMDLSFMTFKQPPRLMPWWHPGYNYLVY